MNTDYPNDADGDALRRVVLDGSDMSKPMVIDFTVGLLHKPGAEGFATSARAAGYATRVLPDGHAWDCVCTRAMLATYESVTAAQLELNALADPHDGYCDGWGTWGNVGPRPPREP